ncbi:MAG: type III-B CRISPR module-associated protein Cmr5 [Gemmataceae bacterium]|nr:type III-B CRISPR module-associated protein Cmr5 [Gemmataceae bacterium]MDW8266395.1 type III-B CRISPR module-associated protein Cmr5 [Gemmataceae bacterium]
MDTLSQRMARAAFPAVQKRKSEFGEKEFKEYASFAKKFPSLIHTCGLAQAVAFAEAKKETDYLNDLAEVLKGTQTTGITNPTELAKQSREQALSGYLRLSKHALLAAGWLKRYVEALSEKGAEP